jgi:hypothetical protein
LKAGRQPETSSSGLRAVIRCRFQKSTLPGPGQGRKPKALRTLMWAELSSFRPGGRKQHGKRNRMGEGYKSHGGAKIELQ